MTWLVEILLSMFIVDTYGKMKDERQNRTPEQREINRHFFWWVGAPILLLMFLGMMQNAMGQTQQFIARDTMGRELGRAVTDSKGNTTFYNERGQTTGRAVTSNGSTTTYDAMGRQTGRITK